MTKAKLLQLKNIDMLDHERVDIASVNVNPEVSLAIRLEQYLLQIKNPYAFKCGEIAVNICFSDNGKSLNDSIFNYLTALKNNK